MRLTLDLDEHEARLLKRTAADYGAAPKEFAMLLLQEQLIEKTRNADRFAQAQRDYDLKRRRG